MSTEIDGRSIRSRDTPKNEMDRMTVRLPDALHSFVVELDETGEYANQSEVLRDAIRALREQREGDDAA